MKQIKNITINTVFAFQILLIFLFLLEEKIQLPVWLQPIGRMHPLLLHLPIGILILNALLPFFKREIPAEICYKIQSFLLLLAAFTASLTALMGLFLAQEEGYDTDLVNWHKWWGLGVSFLTYALLIWHQYYFYYKKGFHLISIINVGVLIVAGHLGATITHGKDYILQPIHREKQVALNKDMPIFAMAIQPILEKKCVTCHNENKAKGNLIMTSLETLLKGGKHGMLWVAGNIDSSHMVQRLKLPLDHEDHMPPKEKMQLSAHEIQLIEAWIQSGADLKQTLADVKINDTLAILVNNAYAIAAKTDNNSQIYDFSAASDDKIKSLNNPSRSVRSLALGSPALHAEIFVRQTYQPAYLEELTAVKEQLVSLNLTNMPIADSDLKIIAEFEHLEKLLLNGTNINGSQLLLLKDLKKLKSMGLSNTPIELIHLQKLKDFPALEEVFVWNTKISEKDLKVLQKESPKIKWNSGYVVDNSEILKLSAPLLKNKSTVLAPEELVTLENKMPEVITRYTTDGSEPDSLTSLIYKKPFKLQGVITLKAKNFKANWQSSEVITYTLFPRGYTAAKVTLQSAPEPYIYKTSGVFTLYDNRKGNPQYVQNSLWLGFQKEPLDAFFYFGDQPPTLNALTLSIGKNIGYRAFPPSKIEVWGGMDTLQMKRLSVLSPIQPKDYGSNEVVGYQLPIPNSKFRYYRVVATPIAQVPAWHHEKQYKPRILVDEVFFN